MGAISPMLGCDESLLGCDLGGALGGAISAVLGCDELVLGCAISSCYLPLSSIFLGWKSFENKIKLEMVLWVRGHILRSTEMIFRLTQFSMHNQTHNKV